MGYLAKLWMWIRLTTGGICNKSGFQGGSGLEYISKNF